MLTFSLNQVDIGRALRLWSTIVENKNYFYSFNGENRDEAMTKTFIVAMENYNDAYDLTPYIKKLARTILKVKDVEVPYDLYNQDGEVSTTFTSLKEYQDISKIDGVEEIKKVFKDLYLYDATSFMTLKNLYSSDTASELKGIRVKEETFKMSFNYLIRKFGAELTFSVLAKFYEELPKLCSDKDSLIREIKMKESTFNYIDKISDTPTIKDIKGNEWGIDKTTLTMGVDPDYIYWDILGSSVCDVLKIDMTPLLDYIYKQVYVTQGVNTKHIQWCGDRYKLITPGGTYLMSNYDKDKYIKLVRTELIMNLLQNNINTIVAISDDNVYIKPTRAFKYNIIRLNLSCGKVIDLPIEVYIKKRKGR